MELGSGTNLCGLVCLPTVHQFFGLPATATLKDIQAAGQHYCEQEWSVLQQQHPKISKADLLKYCFSTSYIVALLRDSLGFDMEDTRWVLEQSRSRIGRNQLLRPSSCEVPS